MNLIQWLLLSIVIACGVSGQTVLKYTLNTFGGITKERFFYDIFSLVCNPLVWFVLICYATGFLIYLFLLSNIEISRLYPTTMALTILLVSSAGILFLNEVIELRKAFGLTLIIIGVYLINQS